MFRFPAMLKISRSTGSAVFLVLLAVGGLGLPLLASDVAVAAPVKGKVAGAEKLISENYTEAAKPESHRFVWREPSPTVRPEFRTLSPSPGRDVCVVALGASPAPAHEPFLVKVTGGRMSQGTMVVAAQTRISFKNMDPFPHRLYLVEGKTWGPDPQPSLAAREWQAPGPGKYEFRDELFPSLRMFVVVEAQAVEMAYPDASGAFAMNLPEGVYSFRAFFEGRPVSHELSGVRVGAGAAPVEIKEAMALGGDTK